MQIERTLNGRDRHFVKIGTDRWQRSRVVGVFARGYAAEIYLRETGAALLNGHRWQEFYNILQFADLQLIQLFIADGVDRDWHVLQILFALLRGHDDDIAVLSRGFLRHCRGNNAKSG